jgi:LPS O-antigen subunit length determinant protein (WzzB/FepE family)
MATLTENNDEFYGKKRNPKKLKGNPGNVDLEFESINPYEFKKGMNHEFNKMGVLGLREATEEDREKATETVIKNLKDVPAYYSYMEHYETVTRNMDRKPSFKTFLKELDGHSMKEIGDKFTEDKMKEIKLKESIREEVRTKINELFKTK